MSFRIPLGLALCLVIGVCFADEKPKLDPKIQEELRPKLVTIKADKTSVLDALKAISKQSGVEVTGVGDEKLFSARDLKLEIDKLPFWQALDKLAETSDTRVAFNARERKIALVKDGRGYREMPTSYSGLFRVVLKRIVLIRDLEDNSGMGLARMEIAWEPRFQGFLLETKPEGMEIKDDKGVLLPPANMGKGQAAADSRMALEIEVPLPPFPRRAAQIGSLKGTLSMIGSPRQIAFTFDKLAKGEKKAQEGVEVAITDFVPEKELWTVELTLKYPAGGPKFESFQSWVVNNEIVLQGAGGKHLALAGSEIDQQGASGAVVRYFFSEDPDQKITFGKPADWKLLYHTPGQIVQVPIPFEFKDVPLP